jgi:hypothetical protein
VVDLLEAEMKAKKLNILGYVQELLLRRYEAIRDNTPSKANTPAGAAGGLARPQNVPERGRKSRARDCPEVPKVLLQFQRGEREPEASE